MARPLKYKTVEALQAAIDQYFADCRGRPLLDDCGEPVLNKYGAPVILDAHPPTVTGLAYALGFSSRKALLDYQGRKQFCNTITRAKLYIESYTEERLFDRDGVNGAKFSLEHNFRWQDAPAAPQGNAPDGLLPALAGTAQAAFADGDDSAALPAPKEAP